MKSRDWKDDLVWLIGGTVLQFALQRLGDWAQAEQGSQQVAAFLVQNPLVLFGARAALAGVLAVFLIRVVQGLLDFRGIAFGEWLRSSALLLVISGAFVVFAHLDQSLGLLARVFGDPFVEAAGAVTQTAAYRKLLEAPVLRLVLDLLGLFLALFSFRADPSYRSLPSTRTDNQAARRLGRAGDHVRAGELYLKAGNVAKAKKAFRNGKAHSRLAVLELREGRSAEAATLFERAGPSFALEASRAWNDAGDPEAASRALVIAVADARTSFRWDRLAEAAEASGDLRALEEACRKLADLESPGPSRSTLYRRAAEAAAASGSPLAAADAFILASEPLRAAEQYVIARRLPDAAREFERAGEFGRAAEALRAMGGEREAHQLLARDAESKGEFPRAAEEWVMGGSFERAAILFERSGLARQAAAAFLDAGKPGRAAPLFARAGDVQRAAQAFEASGQADRAAPLYHQAGELEKAASLYQASGRAAEAAEVLEQAGRFQEAVVLYGRAGRKLDAAKCALRSGHRDLAWENLAAVPRSAPGAAAFFLELAEAHLAVDEPRDAIHILREFLGTSPVGLENLPLHETLARAYEGVGDLRAAVDRLAVIAAVDPSYREAAERRQRLAALIDPLESPLGAPEAGPFSLPPAALAPDRPPSPLRAAQLPAAAPGAMPGPSLANLSDPSMRYEILAELGRGGMGIVHKALDRKLDRFVAIKVLPVTLWGDETGFRYLEREAKAIATLDHPNIVALYDYGEGFGGAYLAMEFLDGPNLQALLKSEPERVRSHWHEWFVQAARGVAAAHAKGILHRDLKPANLMLDRHGTLRILDFGLARPEAGAVTSKLIGTPAFFPPEVLRGEAPSTAGDVYSLGGTFYTLATGRWPYVGDDVLVARLDRDPDDPRPYAPFLSDAEVAVLMKALARFRPERYPDGGELLAALLSLEA